MVFKEVNRGGGEVTFDIEKIIVELKGLTKTKFYGNVNVIIQNGHIVAFNVTKSYEHDFSVGIEKIKLMDEST